MCEVNFLKFTGEHNCASSTWRDNDRTLNRPLCMHRQVMYETRKERRYVFIFQEEEICITEPISDSASKAIAGYAHCGCRIVRGEKFASEEEMW